AKSSGAQTVPTGLGAQSVPTIEISGGGGGRGGRFPKSHRTAPPQAETPDLPTRSMPVLTELEWNGDWQQRYAEVIGETGSAPLCIDHKLDIPTFLLRGHPDCASRDNRCQHKLKKECVMSTYWSLIKKIPACDVFDG